MSVGRIFARAYSIVRSNAAMVFGAAFLLSALPEGVISFSTMGPFLGPAMPGALVFGWGLPGALVGLLLQSLVQAVIMHVVIAEGRGRRAEFGESVGFAMSHLLQLAGVSLLLMVGLGLGFLFFVIPFFFLATRWAVAVAVVVAEATGVGRAFGRSSELTAGARWKVFGLGIVVILVTVLIDVVGLVMKTAIQGNTMFNPLAMTVEMIAGAIGTALWGAMQASLYIELRDWKDGPATDRLVEIFR